MIPGVDSSKLRNTCMANAGLGCTVDDGTIILKTAIPKNSEYYSFRTDYGIPFTTYSLSIKSIPNDVFSKQLNAVLVAAGMPAGSEYEVLEITKDGDISSSLKIFGDISYSVEMPGDIFEANIGSATSSSGATFLLSDAYAAGGPVVIKSREINWGYLLLIFAAIAIIGFALSFKYGSRKNDVSQIVKTKARKR
jgi:hypothetical protein